jgi:threonyl-tRNA synthetase
MENTNLQTAGNAPQKFHIGAYIKLRAEQLHITPVQLNKRMGFSYRNIYRVFKRPIMSVKMLLRFSEVLGENLLDKYHPNVPLKPHPYEAEIISLRNENAQLKSRVNREQQLEEKIKLLEARLEELREVVRGKRGNCNYFCHYL